MSGERWTVTGKVQAARLLDTLNTSLYGNRKTELASLGFTWQWTEHWLLQFQSEAIHQDVLAAHGTNEFVSISAYRQFGRLRLD